MSIFYLAVLNSLWAGYANFSKGQACLRASPLTKRYGWGIHSNEEGKIAIYGADTEEYRQFVLDKTVEKKKAMRNKRA